MTGPRHSSRASELGPFRAHYVESLERRASQHVRASLWLFLWLFVTLGVEVCFYDEMDDLLFVLMLVVSAALLVFSMIAWFSFRQLSREIAIAKILAVMRS